MMTKATATMTRRTKIIHMITIMTKLLCDQETTATITW